MTPAALIEQEMTAAQAVQQDGNHGKARVCARRAVDRATQVKTAPFTTNPVADARLLIAHLADIR